MLFKNIDSSKIFLTMLGVLYATSSALWLDLPTNAQSSHIEQKSLKCNQQSGSQFKNTINFSKGFVTIGSRSYQHKKKGLIIYAPDNSSREYSFVALTDGKTPTTSNGFRLNFQVANNTIISWYNTKGNLIGQKPINNAGIITIKDSGVAKLKVKANAFPGRFSIKNLSFTPFKSTQNQDNYAEKIVHVVPFNGQAAPDGVNIRSKPSTCAEIVGKLQPSEIRNFDAWTYGEAVTDEWTGKLDKRWFKLQGHNGWVASGVIKGNPNTSAITTRDKPLPKPSVAIANTDADIKSQPDFSLSVYREDNIFWIGGYAPSLTNPPSNNFNNPNALGNCTWYASGRAKQLGRGSTNINRLTGNATRWDNQARAAGITLSDTPEVGAIAQWERQKGLPYGHVAVVEQVNEDGSIWISESSYSDTRGTRWDFTHRVRRIPASEPSIFILP